MTIWRWASGLCDTPESARVSLGEGDTPLIRSRLIGPQAGLPNLYFKIESSNPTGSYKDRFAAAAISDMVSNSRTRCVATSSGNTGSALAAYCAAAGLPCHIAVVETATPGKLLQMRAYGADVFRVHGFGSDASITARTFDQIARIGQTPPHALQISAFKHSPVGMTGVQTISYELNEQAESRIDHVFCPAGGGGLTLAVARGFGWLVRRGMLERSPAVECVQPEGNNTIAGPLRDGADAAQPVTCTSQISGLQVPSVMDGDDVIHVCRASGGSGHLVTDDVVWQMQRRLATEEGVFCEPAGAVALAGALRAAERRRIQPDATVVCLVTGTGFKDLESAQRMTGMGEIPVVMLDQVAERFTAEPIN